MRRRSLLTILTILIVVIVCAGSRLMLAKSDTFTAGAPPSSGATAVATGYLFTCVVTATGGVQCWGFNGYGQLGDGTWEDHGLPGSVSGLTSGVAAVTTGGSHACALTTGGGVSCWGANAFGQLGDGTTDLQLTPVNVSGLTTGVVAITAGQFHTCAVTSVGGVKCWGDNRNGQLGDGTTTQRLTPANVSGLTSGAAAVAAGNDSGHTCALTTGGAVKCWGANADGQLGDGTTTPRNTPVAVSGLTSGLAGVAVGEGHTCALTSSGGVQCWGNNLTGQLGDGTDTGRLTPVSVSGLSAGVTAVTAGNLHSCAVMSSGGVQCWGFNAYGQLGDGATTNRSTPAGVTGLAGAVSKVAAGRDHTCAVTTDGSVQCWGSDEYGQLGIGRVFIRVTVGDVVGLTSGVSSLAVGADHGCVVTAVGGAKCWGQNYYGQLGDETLISRATPASVSGLTSGVAAVATGSYHTCALTTTGGLQCWGFNSTGELGDGTLTARSTPAGVVGLTSGVVAVAAGNRFTCALTSAGGVKCWGLNAFGRLGDGTTTDRSTPVDVIGLTSGVVALAVGPAADHMCAVTTGGGLKCWGDNSQGELGDGTTTNRATPGNVIGLTSGVAAVAIGEFHTCALTSAGGVKCWGNNAAGQLGDSTTIQRLTPVDVTGLTSGVSGVTAGSTHACARTTSSGMKCWGGNYGGQLGDGTLIDQPVPVDVNGLASGVAAAGAGYAHTCALTTANGVKCWGNNKAGELGDGRPLHRSTPANASGYGATVTLSNLTRFYDGSPKAVAVATSPSGLAVTVTYTGTNGTVYGPGTTAPAEIGTYTVFATVTDPGYSGSGSATATLTITDGLITTPMTLQFGARKAGAGGAVTAVTAAQNVTVIVTGAGTAWTASSNQPWAHVTGGSSAGSGTFSVAIINPGNVIGGNTSLFATITVTEPNAPNSPVGIPVTLTVDQTGTSTVAAFGLVETPAQNAAGVVGAISVTGWAIDDIGISGVKIYRNCLGFDDPASCHVINGNSVVFIGDAAFVPGARPDVEAAFPTYPAANVAGWGYLMLTNLLPHVTNQLGYGGQGSLSLFVFATDLDGHVTLLGRTSADYAPTAITMANDGIAKPFGAIDTPAQGGTVNGSIGNFGWVLTPDSNTAADGSDILMPVNGSTINVFIDGVPQGTVTYNQCRGDVGNPVPAGLFCNDDVSNIFGNLTPQPTFTTRSSNPTRYRNLDAGSAAIGSFVIDTAAMTNGIHSIAWGVADSDGRGEGIGSRNFFVLNAGAAPMTARLAPFDTRALMLAAVQSRGDVASLPPNVATDAQVSGRTGFSLTTRFEDVGANAAGVRLVQIPDLGRVELRLGTAVDAGYLIAGDTLRDLPGGSHLDLATGTFSWAPGPGYLGTYHLVFVAGGTQLRIDVTIRPMAATPAGESEIRMDIDAPASGANMYGRVTISGWALDPKAWTGSGIDAVHVWAYRRDGWPFTPQFVGAADLGAPRSDVAGTLGAQFDRAGFYLQTTRLAPGEYDLVAFVWCARTGRWEDARTIRVIVTGRSHVPRE